MSRKYPRLLAILLASGVLLPGQAATKNEPQSEQYKLKLATPDAYQLQITGPDRTSGLPYDAAARDAAARQHLDVALLHAVMATESSHNANAVSPAGAVGLMQLMPATAKRFGVVNPRSPGENLNGGAAYLRRLLDRFDQNLDLALAAYNAGEGAVEAHGRKIPPYGETRRYVPTVTNRYLALKKRENPYRLNPAATPAASASLVENQALPELPVAAVEHPGTQQKIGHAMGNDRAPQVAATHVQPGIGEPGEDTGQP